MSYGNLSCVSYNLLKFYQLLTDDERMMPFFFDDFHFCRSRVIELDMTENRINRIFTLCRMITWVVFLRMFWNFISSLPVKREGSLLLVHLDQRSRWTIAITWRPSSVNFHISSFFSETTWIIETKLPRNVHWKVLYKVSVFLCRSEIQDGRHRRT